MTERNEREEALKAENVTMRHRIEQLEVVNKELESKIHESAYTQQYVKGIFDTLAAIFGGGAR